MSGQINAYLRYSRTVKAVNGYMSFQKRQEFAFDSICMNFLGIVTAETWSPATLHPLLSVQPPVHQPLERSA